MHKVLSDGGIKGVCPLGVITGSWAALGGVVRALGSGIAGDCT